MDMETENSLTPADPQEDPQDDHQEDPLEETRDIIACHHHMINIQAQATTREIDHASETTTHIARVANPQIDHQHDT